MALLEWTKNCHLYEIEVMREKKRKNSEIFGNRGLLVILTDPDCLIISSKFIVNLCLVHFKIV